MSILLTNAVMVHISIPSPSHAPNCIKKLIITTFWLMINCLNSIAILVGSLFLFTVNCVTEIPSA